jgi:hypothetical protein
MFTDNPTIPAQLEVLLDVVHVMAGRKATDESLRQLIQPRGLKDVGERSAQVKNHLSAAAELGLIRIDESKNVRLKYHVRGQHQPREAIIEAFDRIAMADAQVEKWAGRFYSFLLLVEGDAVIGSEEAARLTQQFMAGLPSHVSRDNPMNQEKFRALMRWYSYAGLGWTDLAGLFVADPTERVRRALVRIWQEDRQLDATRFMDRLSRVCPELDGGALFAEGIGSSNSPPHRECTRGLATALWRLHDENVIRLRCPADSKGWSLHKAGLGAVTGEASNRFDAVERPAQEGGSNDPIR